MQMSTYACLNIIAQMLRLCAPIFGKFDFHHFNDCMSLNCMIFGPLHRVLLKRVEPQTCCNSIHTQFFGSQLIQKINNFFRKENTVQSGYVITMLSYRSLFHVNHVAHQRRKAKTICSCIYPQ